MAEEPRPFRVVRLHAGDLGAADRVHEPRDILGDEQALAAMHREDRIAARAELAEPGVLRRGPLPEAGLVGSVRLLVTSLEEARERAVRRSREQPAVAEERLRLVERVERPVRRQPALEGAPCEKRLSCRGSWPSALRTLPRWSSGSGAAAACGSASAYCCSSCSAQRSPCRRETRFDTAVAVPAMTAVLAIPRRSPGISLLLPLVVV